MEDAELRKVLETLLFIADQPLSAERLAQICEVKEKSRMTSALEELKAEYDSQGRTLQISRVAGGWQMATRAEYGIWVRKLYSSRMTVRLTQAALETLCIIAYKQPLTRAEIEAIRGVEAIGPLDTLTERRLITVAGRRETPGRPILYGTTAEFLRQFGLNRIEDLPKLETFAVSAAAASVQTAAVELIEEEAAAAAAAGRVTEAPEEAVELPRAEKEDPSRYENNPVHETEVAEAGQEDMNNGARIESVEPERSSVPEPTEGTEAVPEKTELEAVSGTEAVEETKEA